MTARGNNPLAMYILLFDILFSFQLLFVWKYFKDAQ